MHRYFGCLDVGTTYLSPAAFEPHSVQRGSIISNRIPTEEYSGGQSVRQCRSRPESREMNDESELSDLSENRSTDAVNTPPNEKYLEKPWDAEELPREVETMLESLDKTVAHERTVTEYGALYQALLPSEVHPGVEAQGLFDLDDVSAGTWIIEYTGNRITRRRLERRRLSTDYHGLFPDVLVDYLRTDLSSTLAILTMMRRWLTTIANRTSG